MFRIFQVLLCQFATISRSPFIANSRNLKARFVILSLYPSHSGGRGRRALSLRLHNDFKASLSYRATSCLKIKWTSKNKVITLQIMCLISHRISNVSTLPATPARAPGLSILLEITILAESHMSVKGKGFKWIFKAEVPSGVFHLCTSFSYSLHTCMCLFLYACVIFFPSQASSP